MLEVLIGVCGFAAGYAVNWYFGHAALDAVEDELESIYRHHEALLDELDERYDRIADAYATTHGKIAAIRDLIADTTRVRSSRIREVLGE
jgi:hypothetical protein